MCEKFCNGILNFVLLNRFFSLLKVDQQRSSHRRSSISSEPSSSLAIGIAGSSLEDSALGMLMMHFAKPTVKKTSQLQDKLLRLLCTARGFFCNFF